MSISTLLFGDFDVVYSTDLPLHEAVGRLAATTDQVGPVARRGIPTLHGHATVHDVALWRDAPYLLSMFSPAFVGRFVQEEGRTRLRGRFKADFVLKLWLTLPVGGSLFLGALSLFGVNVHWKGTLSGEVVFGLSLVAFFIILHRMNRPGSILVEPLEQAILSAIAGRRHERASTLTPGGPG
ncbi:hypothetical protein [Pseudoxanthomonas sp. Root630]|uniref:hypothetical protein n=1 Tax=Pseudoxanthomonas sp. Root630 TaxID=1736574 RepID=UPI0007037452|nr:hypothetical protein [Pseudoxanthomonas sp. Root630]KRA45246.1 hypothetical protein ASD72_08295 [Pseudoxanthomonas sp. Root630]